MTSLDDEQRALLDRYARATRPRPTEVDHALTRTLARIESETEQRARRLPRHRRGRVLIMAASLVLLIGAGAAMAAVHWLERRSAPAPEPTPAPANAARHDHEVAPNVDRTVAPTRPSTIAPEPAAAPAPDEATSITPPAPQPDANAEPPTPRRRARAEPNKVEPKGEPTPAHQLADESHLLTKLRRALDAGQYASALDWADEHARRHPSGALTEERLLLEAVAACRAGQTARGRGAIGELRDRFPGSPAIARVERACASGAADANP